MTAPLAFGLAFCVVMVVRGIELYKVPMPSDWVFLRPILRWAKGERHHADCHLHGGPFYRPEDCNCEGTNGWLKDRIALRVLQKACDEGRA